MQNFYKRAWAEIHLDRLKHNYEICKSLLSNKTELMAVVKANAYGHGDSVIAPYLQGLGVKYFAVSNLIEAVHIREAGVNSQILILGYVSPEYSQKLIDYDIIQTVTDYNHAEELSASIANSKKLRVHIKLDTGMGRIGLKFKTAMEYVEEIKRITKLENLEVEGIFSHPSVADSDNQADIEYTRMQEKLILEIIDGLINQGISIKHIHYLNSACATYYPDNQSTLARFGIMLYGLHPNHALALPKPLLPVMELKTVVSHIKTISKGDYVSYGRTYVAERDVKVASLTIGYADGYSRLLSSKGEVLINGKKAKLIGRVCMDQVMIDITDIDARIGDTATLFGYDGDECITADDVADIYGTIGYEVICGISKRVPRVIYDGNKQIDILE